METSSQIYAHRIQIEHLNNPLGIDYHQPEIEWLPTGAKQQTAFRVVEKNPQGQVDSRPLMKRSWSTRWHGIG